MKCQVIADRNFVIDQIDRRIFSGFIEHLGRAVYEGVYQPEHPAADTDGFRRDVLELIRELDMPMTRYPGGNFVSGYRWEDGVGPGENRPVRLDLAWKALEPNTFGLGEFVKWCEKAGTAPMMAVNLGTRGPAEAQQLVEYCNFPGGTALSDQRRADGSPKPYNIKVWCLGNEMDGPWQTCSRTAEEYGRVACEAAKMMKWTDPSLELVVCGSSGRQMDTLGFWEEKVLEHTYEHADYLSIHQYFGNRCDTTPGYLAQAEEMSDYIDNIVVCCDAVGVRKKSKKKIMLSFDEWNVWYHSNAKDQESPDWTVARPLLEDIYNMEDALLTGMLLMVLMNHADRVKIACIAQSVNVIAPIMTEKDGAAWRQTIFHPFALTSRYGKGTVLRTAIKSDGYKAEYIPHHGARPVAYENVPYLYCSCVFNDKDNEVVIFAANRSLDDSLSLEVILQNFQPEAILEHQALFHKNLKAVNSAENEAVKPVALQGAVLTGNHLNAVLPPASWNMIRVKNSGRQ